MPAPAAIHALLTTMAEDLAWVAVGWHVSP